MHIPILLISEVKHDAQQWRWQTGTGVEPFALPKFCFAVVFVPKIIQLVKP